MFRDIISFCEYSVNAFDFLNFLSLTFSLPFMSNWYFDLNRSLMYKQILSISGCYFVKFSNVLVLLDPKPLIMKIPQGWCGYKANVVCDLFQLIHLNFSLSFKI